MTEDAIDARLALVRARILAQTPPAEKIRVANVVIDNDGDDESLPEKARAALAKVCDECGVPRGRYGLD